MSNIWHDINPRRISATDFVACIEIPKGGKIKYETERYAEKYTHTFRYGIRRLCGNESIRHDCKLEYGKTFRRVCPKICTIRIKSS